MVGWPLSSDSHVFTILSPGCLQAVSRLSSVIHPLWRVSWCLLRGEGRVPGFIGWGRGLRGPTAPYTTSSVSAPGASSRYLLPAGLKELSGTLWCKSLAFLLAPADSLEFGSLLSAWTVTACHQLSTSSASLACCLILSPHVFTARLWSPL